MTRGHGALPVIATLGVLAIACGGGAVPSGVPASATAGPTATQASATTAATPARTPTVIDRSGDAGYVFTAPAGWRAAGQADGIYMSAPPPITSAQIWEGRPLGAEEPGVFVIHEGTGDAGENLVRGADLDALIASVDDWYERHQGSPALDHRSGTVDGERAAVTEHRTPRPDLVWLDAVVIHGNRAYGLVIAGAADRRDALLQSLDQLFAAVHWT